MDRSIRVEGRGVDGVRGRYDLMSEREVDERKYIKDRCATRDTGTSSEGDKEIDYFRINRKS